MVSHRSGETEDTFIADLVVGLATGQVFILFIIFLYLNYRSKLVLLVALSVWPNTIVSWSLKMSLEMRLSTQGRIIESLKNYRIEALINENILIVVSL